MHQTKANSFTCHEKQNKNLNKQKRCPHESSCVNKCLNLFFVPIYSQLVDIVENTKVCCEILTKKKKVSFIYFRFQSHKPITRRKHLIFT